MQHYKYVFDRKAFFKAYRRVFGIRHLSQKQVDSLNKFISMVENHTQIMERFLGADNPNVGMEPPPMADLAYIFATVKLETAHTFRPVKEAYWLSEAWRQQNLRYAPYYGRGFVQLTWKANYMKMADIFDMPELVTHPDLVMGPELSYAILNYGMYNGTFTGHAFEDYALGDFRNMRRIVNGMDRADKFAMVAERFQTVLSESAERFLTDDAPAEPKPDVPVNTSKPAASFMAKVAAALAELMQQLKEAFRQ